MAGLRAWRLRLAGEQGHRCCYCGIVFEYDLPASHPDAPTIEHVRRIGDKGKRIWENEVVACWLCNNSRGEEDAFAYCQRIIAEGRPPLPRALTLVQQAGGSPRKRHTRVAQLPPPPMTAKLVDYLVLHYGAAKAAEIIAARRELASGWIAVELPPNESLRGGTVRLGPAPGGN